MIILYFPEFLFYGEKQHILLDYEYGFALPTLITGKIGLGIGNPNNTLVLGVRPFPTSGYLQYTHKEKHLFSIEIMTKSIDGSE